MMIYTAKVQWKNVSAFLTLAAAFALCLWGGQMETGTAVSSLSAQPQSALVDFLTGLGWEVSGTPTTDQVVLPDTFGDAYQDFLALQETGGFDLTAYAGQTVTRYTFTISNYPTGEENILADLLVLDGAIIGGELRSPELDGFMTGLVARDTLIMEQTA